FLEKICNSVRSIPASLSSRNGKLDTSLKQKNEQLELILGLVGGGTTDAIAIRELSANGSSYVFVNEAYARMHETTPEDMTGSESDGNYAFTTPEKLARAEAEALHNNEQTIRHNSNKGSDQRMYETKVKRFGSYVITTTRDITDHVRLVTDLENEHVVAVQAKEKAEGAQKMQELFFMRGVHDLRNLLAGIDGMSQLIQLSDNPKENHSYAERILTCTEELNMYISRLLDFSKLKEGAVTIEYDSIFLHEILGSVASTANGTLINKGKQDAIKFRYSIDENVSDVIETDGVRTKQMLQNLVNNAIKFTNEGEVKVHVYLEGDKLCYQVSDTGIGMSPEYLEKLFDPYSQESSETQKKYGGTGLGLAITRDISRLLGGDTKVESSLGNGTVFKVLTEYRPMQRP
ncbi:MAG: sensor histidine kinase, partial [Candidatus Woesearchaeota archaeon]